MIEICKEFNLFYVVACMWQPDYLTEIVGLGPNRDL